MKFLIAVDGSPASLRAVHLAIEFAIRRAAHLILLNVRDLVLLGPGTELMAVEWLEEESAHACDDALKDAEAACETAGIPFAVKRLKGSPASTIDRVTREENVDHIIMGTRGLGSIRGLLVGSVATQVLHLVDVPVTLVK